ncbi:MAG: alpha/beta hydrolase [Caldilinea sp. CFX5]|nr:alpha/beta hydrolase [Caldilinea sp. CFX5]
MQPFFFFRHEKSLPTPPQLGAGTVGRSTVPPLSRRRVEGGGFAVTVVQWWLALLLLLTACAPVAEPTPPPPTVTASVAPTATATVVQPTPTPLAATGQLVEVNGRSLFLACAGDKKPTVLLEAGLGGDHTSWALVQPAVAELARVCSYDRAGLGASAPATTPRTSADVVQDLHQLLAAAGESGPYLLVGHSFGGLFVRHFAHTYPDEVVGIILADAVHEAWWERAAALLPPPTAEENEQLRNFRQYVTSDYADPALNPEGIDIPATAKTLQAVTTLGDMPLLVLVAGVPMLGEGVLAPDLTGQLNQLLQETLPEALTKLSTQSLRITVDNSGHNIPKEQPNVVVAAIRTVLDVVCQNGC